MGMTDPIADMLTRIRNANRVHFKSVDVVYSGVNVNIAKVLKKTGYIGGYDVKKDEKGHDVLKVYLKYPDSKRTIINDIQRVSKPGRRVYVKGDEIPKVLNGYGVAIISTSKGVITDKEAREKSVGGEVLCKVW
ncbi:30S ribosomal protein S8 [Syntrophus aciditrophicus]|uniref:Small ribosomal subunit protein uS8 n=1 Tax=Syntrophus aciditrophicus (strain SB) TaxID=56780 RepID=RS8_SYNAS|nr:30S ribosomal protein S8 [Syntrophus aciditrophicus]Q2LQA6.1 RecName: Full=Small ribosomal subunit protein uS8; AltName: Full=30S ribosomal protein S8 [Syntrophus aciditrophicus SB]ABC76195.1 SSU ribosomal protein S8P [Syntrophus aciditrophicus SB]OPY17619.1 MAG: 30S ribosomal protein S8 [Syntrophus sp. PtaB.Bin075]